MKKFTIIISSTVTLSLVLAWGVVLIEPGGLSAQSQDTEGVTVSLTVEEGISLAVDDATPTLLPNLDAFNNENTATAGATFTVVTNAEGGWELEIQSNETAAPSLRGMDGQSHISDFSAGAQPATWSVTNAVEFGFSVFGTHVDAAWGTGGECAVGGVNGEIPGGLNYSAFEYDASSTTLADDLSSTDTGGEDTTICFAVEQHGTEQAEAGSYQAALTATAFVKP